MKKICDEHMNVSESLKAWRSLQKWVKKNSDNVKDKTNNNRIKKMEKIEFSTWKYIMI